MQPGVYIAVTVKIYMFGNILIDREQQQVLV